jgi:ATP-dependent DNA helicase RecG
VQIIGKIINIKTVEFAKAETPSHFVWDRTNVWFRDKMDSNVETQWDFCYFRKCTFNGAYNMAHPEIEAMSEHEQYVPQCNLSILRQKP